MTSGGILSEAQMHFVLREIEKLRPRDELGTQEEVLFDVILPEFIAFVFCKKFALSLEEATNILNIQEEFLEFNHEELEPLAASTPFFVQKPAPKTGRPKKLQLPATDSLAAPAAKKLTASKRKQDDDVCLQEFTVQKVSSSSTRELRTRSYVARC